MNGQLADKAMIASLNISVWTAKKHDKQMSKETTDKHKMQPDMARVNKSLLGKKALAEITNLAVSLRKRFHELTLPWDDNGRRILTSTAYFDLAKEMREGIDKFADEKTKVIGHYPAMQAEAKILLNGGYNEEDYPSLSTIAGKFRIAFNVEPLPMADDFRVSMADTEANLIRKQIEDQANERQKLAMKDIFVRLSEVIGKMAKKLKEYKPREDDKKAENSFKDSLLENVQAVLDIIPMLKLTDDADIDSFMAETKKLLRYDPYTLRDNDNIRKMIAKEASDILSRMEAFV